MRPVCDDHECLENAINMKIKLRYITVALCKLILNLLLKSQTPVTFFDSK